jgi:hypothetical protein
MKTSRAVLTALTFLCAAWLIALPASAQQATYPIGVPPWAIPGVIQAENYDRGGEGIAWHDTSAGNVFGPVYRTDDVDLGDLGGGNYFIGFIDATEWVEYTVNVATTGQYQVHLRYASAHPGPNNVHIELGGVNVSGTQTLATTNDWWGYTVRTFNVFLTAGNNQTLRVAFDSGSLNLDYVQFVSLTGAVPCSTNLSAPTPQYVPCEFTAVVSGAPANPYPTVDLLATVTPPFGATFTKPLRGFWVGPNGTFKFRFTPTAPGTWQINVQGQAARTFYAGPPTAASAPGFLRRETTSSFTDRFVRDDGSHPFIWGTTYYQIVNNARAIPAPTDSRHWSIALTQMKAHGVRKVRLLVYPWLGTYSGLGVDSQPYGGPPRAGCSFGTLTKCPNYDVVDTAHFDALDKVVDYLYTNGMVADVILYKDPADNNHGDSTPPEDNYRTFGDTLTQDQRMARYIVARYAAYPNVTFCLSNEWENTQYTRAGTPAKDLAYWNAMGNLVRLEDPYYYNPGTGRFRILTIHAKTAPIWNPSLHLAASESSGWLVAAELQYGIRNENYNGLKNLNPDKWGTDILGGAVNYAGTKNNTSIPVTNEEFGYLGEAKWTDFGTDVRKSQRRAMWGLATAGIFSTVGDARGNPQPMNSAIWSVPPNDEYGDLRRLIEFFTASRGTFTIGSNYWQMRRDYAVFGNRPRRVYAFSNPAKTQIVIYDAEGTGFPANLPAGKVYDVYSYNPAVNAAAGPQPYGLPTQSGLQGSVTINTPGGRDTVILCIAR